MRFTSKQMIAGVATVAAAALTLTACGGLDEPPPAGGEKAAGGSLAEAVDLSGQTYTVGSKSFDEQLILCQVSIAALQSVGATVNPACDFGGTNPTRQALLSGEIDMYWGYTGTAQVSFFKKDPIQDREDQYQAVKEFDLQENNIVWLAPSEFNNTYAFALEESEAKELGMETLEDMAEYINAHPNEPGVLCSNDEYVVRDDGLPGLEQTYGFDVPEGSIRVLETGAVYEATAGDECRFGLVFTTDGRVGSLNLRALEDPKQYHPLYNAAVQIRKEAYDKAPQIADLFKPIADALTMDAMLGMTTKVSAENADPRKVARDWLASEGFIAKSEA